MQWLKDPVTKATNSHVILKYIYIVCLLLAKKNSCQDLLNRILDEVCLTKGLMLWVPQTGLSG